VRAEEKIESSVCLPAKLAGATTDYPIRKSLPCVLHSWQAVNVKESPYEYSSLMIASS
jgi:hypothetical protein